MTNQDKPKLWTTSGFISDKWHYADQLAEAQSFTILPCVEFISTPPQKHHDHHLGALLEAGDNVDDLSAHLDYLPLIALTFESFADGRAFSQAELLRTRYKFSGDIRARGDILYDQIPFMLRTGINQFEVHNDATIARLDAGQTGELDLYTQPAATSSTQHTTYSWRQSKKAG